MRKLIIHEFITLDGVIQAPGGVDEDRDGDFEHGGWTMAYWDDEIGKHFAEIMSESDAMLLGRKTWQGHGAAFDPMPEDDPFAGPLNKATKYVVSTTLQSADLWKNSKIIKSNVVEEVKKLKEMPGKNILLDGSSVLAHTLIKNGLVDEFQLHVYPVVLGNGKRLFPEGKRVNLKLISDSALSTGVVFEKYETIH
jgi:dihydrofolate reductase